MNVVLPDIYVYAASALLMRAMLELELLDLMMGFMSGGCTGLSPPPAALESFSSSGFVSLIFFLSTKDKRQHKNTSHVDRLLMLTVSFEEEHVMMTHSCHMYCQLFAAQAGSFPVK